jgi:transcriptional antiterminator NusG
VNIKREDTPYWYVIHTYSGYENKVYQSILNVIENRGLQDKIFAVKIPTVTVEENKDGVVKKIEQKLFPTYVFVKMIMNDEMWHIIRNIIGATGFVGPGSEPVRLSKKEVEQFQIEDKEPEIMIVELNYVVGDQVKICDGQLNGFIGIVREISDDKMKVVVTTSMFGRETKVELPSTSVVPLD